ncbi:hypothetical protein B0H12DRAFT_1111044 [Mycena haematopus]|nr:hypothetical protein B0H12DRAFT_1111044 [Mycena haematopus]
MKFWIATALIHTVPSEMVLVLGTSLNWDLHLSRRMTRSVLVDAFTLRTNFLRRGDVARSNTMRLRILPLQTTLKCCSPIVDYFSRSNAGICLGGCRPISIGHPNANICLRRHSSSSSCPIISSQVENLFRIDPKSLREHSFR